MTEWLSYSLTDLLPFARETYEGLYARHNARFGPAPFIGIGVGVVALLLLLWRGNWRGIGHGNGLRRLTLAAFGLCWLWIAWAFFVTSLAPLLWAAPLFALAFALQAGLLLAAAALPWWTADPRFQPRSELQSAPLTDHRNDHRTGHQADPGPADREPPARQRHIALALLALLALAILAPPLLGLLTDVDLSALALFGTAPDPTALATIALAAMLPRRVALLLLPIPLTWCLLSALMLWGLDSPLWPLPGIGVLVGLGVASVFGAAPRRGRSPE